MIESAFDRARARREIALIPYVLAGFPSPERWRDVLLTVVEAGADLVEIGVPWSDPIADGPTLERASAEALAAGTRLRGVLETLAATRLAVPAVLMTYLNPLLALGSPERACQHLARAGLAGLVVPDLPFDEAAAWRESTQDHGLALVPLVAPTTGSARLTAIAAGARGFVYAVSRTGTTGGHAAIDPALPATVASLRAATRLPIAVGFGLAEPDQIRSIRSLADGAIVGSRLVRAVAEGEDLGPLVRSLKSATRSEDHADRPEARRHAE